MLTFNSDVDCLADGQLWLDEHAAQIRPLIHTLLHIAQLQSPIFVHDLTMVVWQQHPVFIPLDRVIWIADHTAVNKGVTTGHGCDVPHGPDAGRTCKGEERGKEREREEEKYSKKRDGENEAGIKGKRRGFKGEQESHRWRKMEKCCFVKIFGVKEGEKWAEEKGRASDGEGGG